MDVRSRAGNPLYEQIWRPISAAFSGPQFGSGDAPGFPAPAAVRRSRMDDVMNRMARELSDAIAAAVAEDPRVEACRERARAAGFELKVSLEAVIGFVDRMASGALARQAAPQQKALA